MIMGLWFTSFKERLMKLMFRGRVKECDKTIELFHQCLGEVQEYCDEIVSEFIDGYKKALDEALFEMMNFFGYEKEMNSGEWLVEKNFDLLMEEEYDSSEDKKIKTIFLIDKEEDDVLALFMIETVGRMSYRISDVFVRDLGDF
jgi:hypothetical protein